MGLYTRIIRPLLFLLPPEKSQEVAEFGFRLTPLWRICSPMLRVRKQGLATKLAGINIKNPIGVAAGVDKDCRFLSSLAAIGSGYVVGGTVTPNAWPGNPRPRLIRFPQDKGLINAMGFPSQGLDPVAERLAKSSLKVPLLISIAALDLDGFVNCHTRLEPLVNAVELNISSPNTAGIRMFQEPSKFLELINAINRFRKKPLFVKFPPYFDDSAREHVLSLARICMEQGVEGITAINTRAIDEPRLSMERGGLSGKPIFPHMLRIVKELRAELGSSTVINACGGISTGADALAALNAGANTIQLYTSLIFEGPGIIGRINRELIRELRDSEL
jgi:dihydroorotate dehydrogenase